ncbi:MAG: TonB-dependent receptor, partial [Candidatus Binatia bacterium]
MIRASSFFRAAVASLAIVEASSSGVRAQEAAPAPASGGLEEIVITASRRETTLEDTPLAVSAFDQTALEQREISTIEDLAHFVP